MVHTSVRIVRFARSILSIGVIALGLVALAAPAQARPFRGSAKWSVLLCRFSDGGATPRTSDYFRNMFFNRGTGGLADYWDYTSDGGVNLSGSVVKGWYAMGITLAQGQALDRWGRVDACKNAAASSPTDPYTPPTDHLLAVITFPSIDLFGWNGGAFLPWDVDVGGMAHETGHGLGLNHSFSDDPTYQNAPWSQIGEYDDPWDVMSYANAFRVPTASFGDGPVGLNGFHRDRMGWLPRSRIITVGADGAPHRAITLAPLNRQSVPGPILIRVPYDPGDLNRAYTIEFRRQFSWDGGIPTDIVLIHEVLRRADGVYYSLLLRERTGARNPVQSLAANGVSIVVNAVNAAGNQATVTIDSPIVDRCVVGFVWREARSQDHVCVTPAVRGDTTQENQLAASRRNPNGGPFGPDTCLPGFVWREAFGPSDHVCVPPPSRTRAAQDNAQAANRRNPSRNAFGPNTCTAGFVWREADDRDWVCVTPAIRQQTAADNAAAPSRRNPAGGPFGPDTCLSGFVWREAFPGDHACVVPATRGQAWADNRDAGGRLQFP